MFSGAVHSSLFTLCSFLHLAGLLGWNLLGPEMSGCALGRGNLGKRLCTRPGSSVSSLGKDSWSPMCGLGGRVAHTLGEHISLATWREEELKEGFRAL